MLQQSGRNLVIPIMFTIAVAVAIVAAAAVVVFVLVVVAAAVAGPPPKGFAPEPGAVDTGADTA